MSPVRTNSRGHRHSEQMILRHCVALDPVDSARPPARTRLEEALGPALAQRLVSSLSLTRRAARG